LQVPLGFESDDAGRRYEGVVKILRENVDITHTEYYLCICDSVPEIDHPHLLLAFKFIVFTY
jgi:hypothetical protein